MLEERHGFNKQTVGFFIKDTIKAILVSAVITVPIVGFIIKIVQLGGQFFFVWLWIFCFVVLMFLMTVYPLLIAPLFDKYTPLQDGPLKTRIEALASKIKFPLTKLYVVEGSKRSAHSNAYLYGLFNNKRIVLYDTLIKGYVKVHKCIDSSSCSKYRVCIIFRYQSFRKIQRLMKRKVKSLQRKRIRKKKDARMKKLKQYWGKKQRLIL